MLTNVLRTVTLIFLVSTCVGCSGQSEMSNGSREEPRNLNQAGTVVVDGLELSWEIAGEGMPCMVIGSPTAYQRVFSETYKKNLRCVLGDSRVFAPGPAPMGAPKEYTFETAAADAESIREAAGFERVVVVGHSIHALMALEYAKRYPDRVSHVVMLAMGPWRGGPEYEEIVARYWDSLASDDRKAAWERNRAMLTEKALAEVSPGQLPVVRYLASAPKRWYDVTYDAAWIFEGIEYHNVHLLGYLVEQVTPDYDVTEGLENLDVPVFLALGVHDYLFPPTMWDDVRSAFPDLTLRLYEKSGHFPMLEESAKFDSELIAWLHGDQ